MKNLKNFREFRVINENENAEIEIENELSAPEEMTIRDHVSKIMNALYGMDEKYEEQISTVFNEKTGEIKIHLDDFNEVSNVLDFLRAEGYDAAALGETEILVKTNEG